MKYKGLSVPWPLPLSLIPPSYMVASNRESANTYYFLFFSVMLYPVEVNNISKDINMDKLRGKSKSSSTNFSRESLTHSDILSVPYMDRIEVQSKNLSWANQIETKIFQLSYATPKKRFSDIQQKANISKDMSTPCTESENINNQNTN